MAKYNGSELCLIWLDSFEGLEYKHKKELYKLINGKDGIRELLVKGKDYIVSSIGENEYNTLLNSANQNYLTYITDGLERRNITVVTIESSDYPETLKQTPFAPLVLYAKGDVSLMNTDCFAMVGSRRSLPIAIKTAERFATAVSKSGFTLVTGIAQGVDETVLRSVTDNGGKVISVLGGGFDAIYPKSNTELVDKIAETGLVITEYPPEVVSRAHHFPIRNRIIAGLSKGVLVVSGAIKSGTQYTANYAMEYGKDLFAIPYGVGVESGSGCNDLIKRGAILADTPSDILNFYNLEQVEVQKPLLTEEQRRIINGLKDGEKHIQQLSGILNKPVFQLTPLLSELEIMGVVNRNGANVFGLTDSAMEE
ncbi:MAG: DNA-processing protein DprA [Clostridia bacterium]|nr:DNA-processing protein DprA [Clostridia bacterium]